MLDPTEFAVRETLPAVDVIAWAVKTVALACGLMVTALPVEVMPPTKVPAPATFTTLPALLKVSVPIGPEPLLVMTLPVKVTVKDAPPAPDELAIVTAPPVPPTGALAVMLPVTPLFATAAPTTNGFAASLYVMLIMPPLPVPKPLASKAPVNCSLGATAPPLDPDTRVMLPPLPLPA